MYELNECFENDQVKSKTRNQFKDSLFCFIYFLLIFVTYMLGSSILANEFFTISSSRVRIILGIIQKIVLTAPTGQKEGSKFVMKTFHNPKGF